MKRTKVTKEGVSMFENNGKYLMREETKEGK